MKILLFILVCNFISRFFACLVVDHLYSDYCSIKRALRYALMIDFWKSIHWN